MKKLLKVMRWLCLAELVLIVVLIVVFSYKDAQNEKHEDEIAVYTTISANKPGGYNVTWTYSEERGYSVLYFENDRVRCYIPKHYFRSYSVAASFERKNEDGKIELVQTAYMQVPSVSLTSIRDMPCQFGGGRDSGYAKGWCLMDVNFDGREDLIFTEWEPGDYYRITCYDLYAAGNTGAECKPLSFPYIDNFSMNVSDIRFNARTKEIVISRIDSDKEQGEWIQIQIQETYRKQGSDFTLVKTERKQLKTVDYDKEYI